MIRPLTSASNLLRRKLCPGSAEAEAGRPEEASEDATEGTMLHERVAREEIDGLTDDQAYCVNFCNRTWNDLIEKTFYQNKPKIIREVELELHGEVFGHADFVARYQNQAICLDWKFGRIAVDSAEANLQLRAYALMVHQMLGVDGVMVGIVQPRLSGDERVSLSQYGLEDFALAEKEINGILKRCSVLGAPRFAIDEACRYCRAKADCPALIEKVEELAKVGLNELTAGNAAEIYGKAKLVEKHLGAIKSAIYLLVQNAEAENRPVPGLKLKPGGKRRSVTDAQAAFQVLSEKLAPSTFAGCCTVKIGELEEAWKVATGLKAKDAKADLETKLAGCLEIKSSEPTLVLE